MKKENINFGDKIIGFIYGSDEYDTFKYMELNRVIDPTHVDELVKSIAQENVLNPIIVNKNKEIIEGQHRFEALKQLSLPIRYVIEPDANEDTCILLNQADRNWGILDYVHRHAKSGKIDYIRIESVCFELDLTIARALRLAGKDTKMHAVKSGELSYTEENEKQTRTVYKKAEEIYRALGLTIRRNDAFYSAVYIATHFNGYEHEWFLRNCQRRRNDFIQCSNVGDMLKVFEQIYNYRRDAENRIYFSDYMRTKGYSVRSYDDQGMNSEKKARMAIANAVKKSAEETGK